jgi:hypothetical protein
MRTHSHSHSTLNTVFIDSALGRAREAALERSVSAALRHEADLLSRQINDVNRKLAL